MLFSVLVKVRKITIVPAMINSPFVTRLSSFLMINGPERPVAPSLAPISLVASSHYLLSNTGKRGILSPRVLIFHCCFLWIKLPFPGSLIPPLMVYSGVWVQPTCAFCWGSLFSRLCRLILALLLRGLSQAPQSKSHRKHDQIQGIYLLLSSEPESRDEKSTN